MANENLIRLIEQTPDIKNDSKRSTYLLESQPESLLFRLHIKRFIMMKNIYCGKQK